MHGLMSCPNVLLFLLLNHLSYLGCGECHKLWLCGPWRSVHWHLLHVYLWNAAVHVAVDGVPTHAVRKQAAVKATPIGEWT